MAQRTGTPRSFLPCAESRFAIGPAHHAALAASYPEPSRTAHSEPGMTFGEQNRGQSKKQGCSATFGNSCQGRAWVVFSWIRRVPKRSCNPADCPASLGRPLQNLLRAGLAGTRPGKNRLRSASASKEMSKQVVQGANADHQPAALHCPAWAQPETGRKRYQRRRPQPSSHIAPERGRTHGRHHPGILRG